MDSILGIFSGFLGVVVSILVLLIVVNLFLWTVSLIGLVLPAIIIKLIWLVVWILIAMTVMRWIGGYLKI